MTIIEELPEGQVVPRQCSRSVTAEDILSMGSQDDEFVRMQSAARTDLDQVDVTVALRPAATMFASMMDPNNREVQRIMEDHFHGPVKEITDKAVAFIRAMEVDARDVEQARAQIELARELTKVAAETRAAALDHVYEHISKQVAQFSVSVEQCNEKMKETCMNALEMFRARVEFQVQARQELLKVKKDECAAALELQRNVWDAEREKVCKDAEAKATAAEFALGTAAKEDDQKHTQDLRAQERAEKKEQAALLQQQRKDEQQHKKELQEIERQEKKLQQERDHLEKKMKNDHDKAMKELEAREKKGKIDRQDRDAIVQEYKVELDRYSKEFALAQAAMRDALQSRRTCHMTHTAPKIDWGPPARVVPGSVAWQLR